MKVLIPPRRVLDGRFLLRIDRSADAENVDTTLLRPLLDAVAGVGRNGGFTTDAAQETRFGQNHVVTDAAGLRADLTLAGIDGRFVECIRASLTAAGLIEAFATLRLAPQEGGEALHAMPPPETVDGRAIYPPVRAVLAFGVQKDTTITSRMRRVVVTGTAPQSARDRAALHDWVAPWGAALELGAFTLPHLFPQEAECVFGGVQSFERDSLEIVVDRFDADEEAFSVLLNMLDLFARTQAPIVLAEIF